jgi:hypothetical protein
MLIKSLSIIVFTFTLSLVMLGAVTWWMERGRKRVLGVVMMVSGLSIATGYAFLGSRFAIALFGRLVITVDLPHLMAEAVIYTLSMLLGGVLAGGLFLWISGRLVQPTRLERHIGLFVLVVLVIALIISWIAILLST